MEEKKLKRKLSNKMIAGVCSGIAEYFQVDVTVVRVAWAIFTCFYGAGILAYILCLFIMPTDAETN